MFRKYTAGLLILAMLLSSFCAIPVFAGEPTLAGSFIPQRAYTNLSPFNQDIYNLNNQNYDGPFILNKPEAFDDSAYIDIFFNDGVPTVKSFDVACNTGLMKDQAITELGVVGFDDANGVWKKDEQRLVLDYNVAAGDTTRAVATLETPITSSKIRVYIRNANVTWGTIRIEELAAYGDISTTGFENLAGKGTVTADFDFVAGSAAQITDGIYGTEVRSEFAPTAEKPGIVTFDFGENYYDLTSLEMIGIFAKQAGIKSFDIEYKVKGEWTKYGQTVTIARPHGLGADALEFDEIPLEVTTNALRLKITETYTEWGHFRFGEIVLRGTEGKQPDEPSEENVIVTTPKEMAVIQRNGEDKGNISVTGKVAVDGDIIEAILYSGEMQIASQQIQVQSDRTFEGALTANAGGWYKLVLTLKKDNASIGRKTISKVGIGDVFIIAGQSNSANYAQKRMQAEDDRIVAYNPNSDVWGVANDPQPIIEDGTDQAGMEVRTRGSTWPAMTNELIKHTNVPIGLYSCGRGASTIDMWQPKYLDDPAESNNPQSQKMLYRRIRQAIELLKPTGFKAILWHQGDSEPSNVTAQMYVDSLNNIIEQSRIDAGFEVPWLIAKASWGYTMPDDRVELIGNAQEGMADKQRKIFKGADTNQFTQGYRVDDWHFNSAGQINAGRKWAEAILKAFDIPQLSDIEMVPPLDEWDNSVKLDARAYTKMEFFNMDNSDMTRLHDGKYNDPVIFSIPGGRLDENDYIDINFNGVICKVIKFDMACNKGLQPDQSISKFKVYAYNDQEGTWSDDAEEVTVNWSEIDGDVIKATVSLQKPVTTSRVRLQLTEVKATWETIRVQEFAPYGLYYSGKVIEDLSKQAEITSNIPFVHGSIEDISDKQFATEFRSEKKVTPADPGIITFDFKDSYFNINAAELVSIFANSAGIKQMDIEYRDGGEWVKLGDTLNFQRPNGLGSDKFELDRIDIGKVTNGIRFLIKDTYYEWSHFRISEIMLYGKEAEKPKTPTSIYEEITADQGFEALFDGNLKILWTSAEPTVPTAENPHEIKASFKRTYLPKTICFHSSTEAKSNVKSVTLGYYTDGIFHPFKENAELNFVDSIASVKLDSDIVVNNLSIRITGADSAGYSLTEISILALDPYESVNSLIEKLKETKSHVDYEIAQASVDKIEDSIAKEEFQKILDDVVSTILSEQSLKASYHPDTGMLEVTGCLFEAEGSNIVLQVQKDGEILKTLNGIVGKEGALSMNEDFSDITQKGEYLLTATVKGKQISAAFTIREASQGHQFLTFRIDGRNGTIQGTNIKVTLPAGSSKKGRTPIFTVSENAKVYWGETEVISGITKIDFDAVLKVVAENGDSTSYSVSVTVKSNGGGGGTGGGSGSGDITTDVTIPVNPKPENTDFSDVPQSHWAYPFVSELKKAGIVDGVTEQNFEPDSAVKREELVKMLVAMKGYTGTNNESSFEDIRGHWSEKYILTAVQNGLVKGVSETLFGIGENVTREDLAVMIYRSLSEEQKNIDLSGVEKFEDDALISDYAKTAVYTLRALGMISGHENCFRPTDSATRAEAAKILCGAR